MVRGYAEGPANEERFDALEREEAAAPRVQERSALYGATPDEPEQHFIAWADEVDADELFASGRAWGLKVVRRRAD